MAGYDIVIVGAGPGGYVAAIRAAQLGLNTALVEKEERLGGTCLNVGCIPTKALLESSEHYHKAVSGLAEHGVRVGDVELNLPRLVERKNSVVKTLTDGIAKLMKRHKVDVIRGTGQVLSAHEVHVGETALETKAVLLAMGSVPVELPHLPIDGEHLLSSQHALGFERVPESMVVVGAGAVGLELASVWSRLGAQVTVVEMMPQIVPFADRQLAKMLERSLKKQGLQFKVKSKVTQAKVDASADPGKRVEVTVEDKKGREETLHCEKLLVAVGRRPNTRHQNLEELGVALDERGRVKVDETLQTSVEGIYAIGDLTAGPMLAHKAEEEGVFVVEQLAGQKPKALDHDLIPNVVYTWPELAQVGLTEDDAKDRGIPCRSGRFYFAANGRALAMGEGDGLVKAVAHKEDGRLLGVHLVGPAASELVAEATVALARGMTSQELGRLVHAHPTLSEAVKEGALAVTREAIHG